MIRKWVWWESGGIEFSIGQQIDGLAVMALLLVAFISLLVQIYSVEYVRGDRRYTHFFAAITLFSAGMLVMVLAENMVQFILGWEIMGLCSFMLIGHWWEEEPNAIAASKAFFTVRVGDVGLLVGVAILFFGANTWAEDNLLSSGFSIQGISGWALSGEASHTVLLWAAVALFVACIGKSGQFPLHTWLPDAMAGPTPVSSLLHSSTMVVGGVFLVARLYPVFWEAFSIPDVSLNLIVVIAAITIVISALLAFVQNDIKKVLAYSTVGQLGYMMLGLGAGAWLPAVFHIFTHAFFKCALFLCAGSVSHSGSHHSFDMKKDMGGLAKKMPITATCWIIAALALAGVFPLAGFFSKDEIIDNVGHNGYEVFMWIALGGAFLTAAYTVRATYLTFFGEPRGAAAGDEDAPRARPAVGPRRSPRRAAGGRARAGAAPRRRAHPRRPRRSRRATTDHGTHHGPRESPKLILIPICILAFMSIAAGFANAVAFGEDWARFAEYVEPRPEAVPTEEAAAAEVQGLRVATPPDDGDEHAEEGAAAGEEDAHATGCGYTAPRPASDRRDRTRVGERDPPPRRAVAVRAHEGSRRRGDRPARRGDRRRARARPGAARARREGQGGLPGAQQARRAVPRLRNADRPRGLRGAHHLLLPDMPDRRANAQGPPAVAPTAVDERQAVRRPAGSPLPSRRAPGCPRRRRSP